MPLLLTAVLPALAIAGPVAADERGVALAQLMIERHVTVRVRSFRPQGHRVFQPPVQQWKEKRAPSCLAVQDIRGTQVIEDDSLDFVLADGERRRAEFKDDCASDDFYLGFYMRGNKDGRICADRDILHARTGAKCKIDRFRRLVPDK